MILDDYLRGPKPKSDGLDRDTRYRRKHPDRIKARNEKFRRENPNYARDYWLKRKAAA